MKKRFLIVPLLLILVVLLAVPVFAAQDPSTPISLHYNHFSTNIVKELGMFDSWVSAGSGRNVFYDEDTNAIRLTFGADALGTTFTTSYVDIDDLLPFMLAGDRFCYYAGGGGTYADGGGLSLMLYSMETSGYSVLPRAYEHNYPSSGQLNSGNATCAFQIKIPSDAQGEYVIPYIGFYRVNDENRSYFTFIDYSDPNFGSGSTDLAQGIFVPFDLQSLIVYVRDEGYGRGYYFGQQDGFSEGRDQGYQDGRVDGLREGYEDGKEDGELLGYNAGYAKALEELGDGDYSFAALMNAVVSVPIQAFSSLLNFEIFGVNMLGFFGSILVLVFCSFIVRHYVL